MAVAVIDGSRTGFSKIATQLKDLNAVQLGVKTVDPLVSRYNLASDPGGMLVFGTVIQHAAVSNIAREVALESTLHPMTRSFSTILACATSLSCVAEAAHWIERGLVKWALAGGSESMSNFPVSFSRGMARALRDFQYARSNGDKLKALMGLRPKDVVPQVPAVAERLTGLTMGEHCELMAKEWHITREEQDDWALKSHQAAAAAGDRVAGFITFGKDNLVRGDSTKEKLAKLKPAFDKTSGQGTLTAGNSSPLTDGAATVLLADLEFAKQKGWPILAVLDDFEQAAVDIRNEGLLMAPPYAILRLLKRQGVALDSFDFVDLHEAFAAQCLCNLKALQDESWTQKRVGLPATKAPSRDRINVWGGSVSIGHPFAATGARMVMQTAKQLSELKGKSPSKAMISICAAGGLGMIATLKSAP
jgi:acetyl-CoA C-acetyltransferase